MDNESNLQAPKSKRYGFWGSLGPAIITASVVLGPGSILSASKIGQQYGYSMSWVLLVAVSLMLGMTALSARLGVLFDHTLCEEMARRAGRWLALLAGTTIFLIVACFQFSNNLGVLAALEPFFEDGATWVPAVVIVNLNVFAIVALFGSDRLYKPIERLMKLLIGLMIVGFAANLVIAKPDISALFAGFKPSLPSPSEDGGSSESLTALLALFGTTFSVAGAFYQSYLVREKGWTRDDLKPGLIDSTVGICTLGFITLMVMTTAAAVFNKPETGPITLKSVADVALALKPLFGSFATGLFCLGIFAGAFSSFLVNAMIGGCMMSDGLGWGGSIDLKGPKLLTVLALICGMNIALYVQLTGQRPVNLIIFAQSMTVMGLPILAAVLLWLSFQSDLTERGGVPVWMKIVAFVGLGISIFVAGRTATNIYGKLTAEKTAAVIWQPETMHS
ncbi:Nramp family divalent metal transporter [Thalassoroseus pseudoceratinae]|uniref:Nramp family divalent metal transporter n=1 Tax=Thalassoroseus pseudoceratinae TaxID=2713176 RepID=UPI00141F6FD7|nr:Nramp family divalent metal transporter [Thalassoroseus pseudoceratinae]